MLTEWMPVVALMAMLIVVAAVAVAIRRGRQLDGLQAPGADGSAMAARGEGTSADDARLLGLADRLGAGLLWVDATRRIRGANQTAHLLLSARPGGLDGKTTMEAFVDHSVDELIGRAAQGGEAEQEFTVATEPQSTVLVRAWPSRDDHGIWVALIDASELRRLQRIRTEFIDNLSHELRTPLSNVRLLSESLALELERTELPPRIRDSIVKIEVETGHLVQMVNELLDLANIEQGEVRLRLEDVDLGRVVETTIERLRLYAERQGVQLRGEMPAPPTERLVRGDEERLAQLLVNLVHNAVKFSPDGGEVAVRIRPAEREVLIEVEDHGVGIPRRDLERIFERFYKVDRARSRGGGGTGLGLSIARHIAERHGGRMWAESEEGKGSRFTVALPRPADQR